MALTPSITTAVANAMLSGGFVGTPTNSGKLRIYDGVMPTDSNTALSGNNLLAELTLNATAFPAPSGGVLTANAVSSGTAAATGTASFFRIYSSNGTTVISQGSVGTSGCDMNINSTAIQSGANVSVTSLTITQPQS